MRTSIALFYVTQIKTVLFCCLTLPFFLSHLWTGSWTEKSRSWLQWAAGGCSSPTVVACLAPRRCRHPGALQVSQTWALASNLSVSLAGTDHGAARRQSHMLPPPRFRPAHPPVSTRPLVYMKALRVHSKIYCLVFCFIQHIIPVWLVIVFQRVFFPVMTQFILTWQ